MIQEVKLFLKRLSIQLWFKPLLFCVLSIIAALISHVADMIFPEDFFPEINKESIETLLSTISASMLVISIFAVGSMISAFSSASSSATPRSFKVIVADDVSQYALSVFIASFIFSIVATVALKNEYFGAAGHFILFLLTIFVFALVIMTFLKWMDQISKLGRMAHTIEKIEEATMQSFVARRKEPFMGGRPVPEHLERSIPVYTQKVGFVQFIKLEELQQIADAFDLEIIIHCLPGAFVTLDKPLIYYHFIKHVHGSFEYEKVRAAFEIADTRSFSDDPRFGLIAMSEIASRALSPGINDPGTAVVILGTYVRLFSRWFTTEQSFEILYDRLYVPELSVEDMLEDAFRPIARDGAGNIEVMIKLQKALKSIWHAGNAETKAIAVKHSEAAFERAKLAMKYEQDIQSLTVECLSDQVRSINK